MLWQIGECLADDETDTLAIGDSRRKIERRAMEVLLYLAERQGKVVTKDDLIAGVWGRVAVSDHAVAMVISQLRQALADDARTPRYIETITKRGYRLIASAAQVVPGVLAPSQPAEIKVKSVRPVRWSPPRLALATAVIAVALGLTFVFLIRQSANPPSAPTMLLADFKDSTGENLDYLALALTDTVGERLQRVDGAPFVHWRDDGGLTVADIHRLLGPQPIKMVSGLLRLDEGKPVLSVIVYADDDLHIAWRRTYAVSGASIDAHALLVSRDVAAALNMKFSEDSAQQPYQAEAQVLYWRAKAKLRAADTGSDLAAREILLRAIRAFPDFAPAHALLADIDTTLSPVDHTLDPIAEARSELATAEALALPTSLTESAHAKLAFVADHDVPAALRHAKAAVQFSTARAHLWRDLAEYLAFQGRIDEAIEALDRAYLLDISNASLKWQKAWLLYVAGRFGDAHEAAQAAAKSSPFGQIYLAFICDALKRDAEAVHHWTEFARNYDLKPETYLGIQAALKTSEPGPQSYRRVFELIRQDPDFKIGPIPAAFLAARAGDNEGAVRIMLAARATLRTNFLVMWMDRIPPLAPLLRDPRLKPIADELKLLRESMSAPRATGTLAGGP